MSATRDGRPNVILINCDDLGWGDLAPYGNRVIETPNVRRLAEGGVRFDSFYACNSLCTPSRFGLLTGRYPERAGLGWVLGASREGPRRPGHTWLTDLYDRQSWAMAKWLTRRGLMDYHSGPRARGIPDTEITIATALGGAGYRTGMVGKWHLGEFPVYPAFHPGRHGFDSFFGVPHSNDMRDFALYRNEECLSPDFKDMDRLTGLYTEEALRFIGEAGDKPFFLYLAHTYPHQPLHASERFRGKSRGGLYGDAVEELDWSLGEILRSLETRGILDDTLVVFTSDNGPWYNGSPGPFRGRKGQSYEGGYRIPMIAHWPARIPRGTSCDAAAMNIDWLPTILAMAGVEPPKDRVIDGRDIGPLLRGETRESPHETLYFYHNEGLEALRHRKWKYIPRMHSYVWPVPLDRVWGSAGSAQAPWLFDLESDPGECYNLKDDRPAALEEARLAFEAWEAEMSANPGGWLPGR